MKPLLKEIQKTEKAEQKFKEKKIISLPYKDKLTKHIPDKLQKALDQAFEKAFQTAFLKGTALLEKTYDKSELEIEYESKQLMADRKLCRKHIRNMDKSAKKSVVIHDALSTASGTAMGLFGLGLPDIPVLVSLILRHIYTCALSYGYDYESDDEKIFILHTIRKALASDDNSTGALAEEIPKTARALSEQLLIEKFIQGIPVIGAVGGIINHQIVKRISKYAQITYKKRWLEDQRNRLN